MALQAGLQENSTQIVVGLCARAMILIYMSGVLSYHPDPCTTSLHQKAESDYLPCGVGFGTIVPPKIV